MPVDGIKIATQTHQRSVTFAYKYVADGDIQAAFFIVVPPRIVLVFLALLWTLVAFQSLRYSFQNSPYLWHLIVIANSSNLPFLFPVIQSLSSLYFGGLLMKMALCNDSIRLEFQ